MTMLQLPGPIVVVDVETTGFYPLRGDRVVEIAAIVVDEQGEIVREFVSLVNPGRDVGPTSIHGLTPEDLLHAPHFADIAGLLVDILHGTLAIAAHNVRFDYQFVVSEFSRIGVSPPQIDTLCTMQLAGGGKLTKCCCYYGIPFDSEAHHALADARAAARLLTRLLPKKPEVLQWLSGRKPVRWPAIPHTGKPPLTRHEARKRQSTPPNYLQRLLERKHRGADASVPDGAVMAYIDLLDRVLEDRRVDESEADALVEMAESWDLGGEQISAIHGEYMNQLAAAALADGVVTEAERRDLNLVARLLGQTRDLDEILNEAAVRASFDNCPITATNSLVGKRVCFTGELQSRYNGQPITRELAEELARSAGLIVVDSVTKKLDLLVVADPYTQSGKAKKARQYGIRIMHEAVFWKSLGIPVE